MRKKKALVFLLVAICMLITVGCQNTATSTAQTTQTLEQLRAKYPLYNNAIDASGARVPLEGRIKVCTAIGFATVTSDAKLVSIPIEGGAVGDKAYTDKHLDSSSANMYVYSIKFDDLVAGKVSSTTIWVYNSELYMTDYLIPKTGDKLFFLLKEGTESNATSIRQQKGFSSMPVVFGMPTFYVADGNEILSVLNAPDMTSFDMIAKNDFRDSIKAMWDKTHPPS